MYNLIRRSVLLSNKSNIIRPLASNNLTTWKIQDEDGSNRSNNFKLGALIGASIAAWGIYKFVDQKNNVVHAARIKREVGEYRPELQVYTMADVAQHADKEHGIWVVYKEGVYDVTKFVDSHPGGKNILLAAGASVEPFWLIYGIHKDDKILQMLEDMRIGNVSAEESKEATKDMEDPYGNDPRRHPVLKVNSQKPFNAEPVPSLLVERFHTPNEIFYVRNHLPVPQIDASEYELEVEVQGKDKKLIYSLDQLKKMPKTTINATLMCAGNRRSEMSKVKAVKGLSWGFAAVGNASWSGPRLRDVLLAAGVDEDNANLRHVVLEGYDMDPTGTPYSVSIPLLKAMDKHGDVILAYEMNGQPLSRDHGYPVRVIVPGFAGARNVKWVGRIFVSETESQGFWQQNDYKGFSPSIDWDTVDFKKAPPIQNMPVYSAICVPAANDNVKVEDGFITVKGYAWSGGEKIIRVDVTADGGKTWYVANIDSQDTNEAHKHWSWSLWSCKIPVKPKTRTMEIWAKAVDSSYNTQPETFENTWNLRGLLSNAYHRVPIYIKHTFNK